VRDRARLGRPYVHSMRRPWRFVVACMGAVTLACGARSGLLFDEGASLAVDAAKPKSDPCAVYRSDAQACRRAMCDFIGCGMGPVDAEVTPTKFACVSVNGPVPADICGSP
jgi:hypothetical protein